MGGVLDFVGGRADLEARILRAVGDPAARFAEDPLRLLRAVRLACKLGFEIEPATWSAMQRAAGSVVRTSGERIRDELLGILTGPQVRRGFELLQSSGLLAVIAPEVEALRGVMQSPTHHPEGDVWEHTLRVLDAMRNPTATLALGALLHDVGKPATRRVDGDKISFHGHPERGRDIAAVFLDRLRFPTRTRDIVLFLVEQHLRFLNVRQMKRATLRRFLLQDHFDELLELHRLDRTGSSGDLTLWEFCKQELETLEQEAPSRRPLLSGDDLIALGHTPGPKIGRILHALVDAQLEGEIGDRDAALAWLRRHHPGGAGGETP
jgi:poly(A) polymerase